MSRSRNLESVVRNIYGQYTYRHCYYNYPVDERDTTVKYLEIPINKEVFEVPMFALYALQRVISDGTVGRTDAIVVSLADHGRKPGYKTLERNMVDVLECDFESSKLIRVDASNGSENVRYYGTHGAIFDDGYSPVAMYTCQIKRTEIDSESHTYSYEILKPILRIRPDSYKTRGDSMEKFITNKLILTSISDSVAPCDYNNTINTLPEYNVEVVIGDIPFKPIIADSPSISTTNKELLELVVDHIEEVIQ